MSKFLTRQTPTPGWTKREREEWIDEFERVMFPHQESEEEQESFTDVGRKRVGGLIDRVASAAYEIAMSRNASRSKGKP